MPGAIVTYVRAVDRVNWFFGRIAVYMIFAMGRPDVWPAGDLALQTAQQRLRNLDARPKPKQSRELAADWAPWRSAAAVMLWHYYRTMP